MIYKLYRFQYIDDMFNKLVYRLTKILVHDYVDETHKNLKNEKHQ